MQPDRWVEICGLYDQALNLPPEDRTPFLKERCADDRVLFAEVESLLSNAERNGLLDSDAGDLEDFQTSSVIAGRFRIAGLLGRGGMGKVYEAEDLHLKERVALKTIRPELASNPRLVELFKKEIQVAKKVTHRNVCRIHDVGFHPSSADPDARMFLTMELLSGETLAARVAAGPMTAAEALPVIQQLAEGLGAAHQANVIHRDFKTSNVILASDHGKPRAVITDFGLARAIDAANLGSADSTTRTWDFAGTPAYMAPEQLTGGAITPATDIYAFGIVIYEMMTGTRPFHDESPLRAAVRRLSETPPSPRKLAPSLEPHWETAILRCLHPSPEARFQTTSDLLLALAGKQDRRRWKFSAAAIVALAIAATATLLLLPRNSHSAKSEPWQQVTNFVDAATDPAFSPDGRMLTFKLGGSWYLDKGQIYVKMLPDGPPVQITSEPTPKMAPVFSPDGSSVAYSTGTLGRQNWQVKRTSVLPGGGPPRLMLSNAGVLTWIDKDHILFGEKNPPVGQMSIVTATESRTDEREIYTPAKRTWNARLSALSPDRKQVLIVEMEPRPGNNASEFFPCRLVPFDGSSKGRLVGPVPSHCVAAAWSPDGKWMYFSARASDKFHLWRQRTEGGEPEQITSGPTEEKGFAIAPDGRSVIACVGADQSAIWLHDANGEHQISGEGNGTWPRFAPDGKRVYYLWAPDLFVIDLTSGHIEKVLPGVSVSSFAISPDGKEIAYIGSDGALWYGAIDHSAPARKLAAQAATPEFSAAGDIVFEDPKDTTFFRVHSDGGGLTNLSKQYGNTDVPISSISPDGEWAMRQADGWNVWAYSRRGDRSVKICERCLTGWTSTGKSFLITFQPYSGLNAMTALIRLTNRSAMPEFPRDGIHIQTDLAKIRGIQVATYQGRYRGVSPSPDGSSFAFVKQESHWNLYRIPLP